MFLVCVNEIDPLIFGLSFLEKDPPEFECLQDHQQVNDDGSTTTNSDWVPCTQEEICDQNIPKDRYRPKKDNDEYIDNWIEKFDLLCEQKWKIGLIGSMYFIGVIVGMSFVPPLSDAYGRKVIFIVTLIISVVA